MKSKYDEEIFDWKMEQTLTHPTPEKQTCGCCNGSSIYVDMFDVGYRHMGMKETLVLMCIDCYYEYIVLPMDDQWDDYHSSLL